MRGILLLTSSLLLCLAGCAAKPLPGIETQIVHVPTIVTKACVATADIPTEPAVLPAPPDDLEKALALSLAKVSEWMRYGGKADIVMHNCSK